MREYLRDHHCELAARAAAQYPGTPKVAGTPLLARPGWIPGSPLPLDAVGLRFRRDAASPAVTGTGNAARPVLPARPGGQRYRRYSEAVGELAAPALFEDRPAYRLLAADLAGRPGLEFGPGRYFDAIDTGQAAAHEYAAACLGSPPTGLRAAIGDPCDLSRRPAGLAVATLTLRHDRRAGRVTFPLHWRDPASVGHAGGLWQVVPLGVFQPSGTAQWNERNDFSLWRSILRESAEELLGYGEDYGSEQAPIDYGAWPFARRMTSALTSGYVRAYCLGLGVDPLTFATDLLTVMVIDAPVFDGLFGGLARVGAEGKILPGFPFDEPAIRDLTRRTPMQPAGAALLRLAWRHRGVLTG